MSRKLVPYYDDPFYDYKKFWRERKYEDKAERLALRKFFNLIPENQKESLIDIGGGFGRLAPEYTSLFEFCLLVDPSKKLLHHAQKLCRKYKNLSLKKGFIQKLPVKSESFDIALLIRVLHHLTSLSTMISEARRILKPNGFLILEFANKIHLKNCLKALSRLDFRFFTDHMPEVLSQKKNVLPFINYHPNHIKTLLLSNGFKIVKTLSVSNLRHPLLKKILPLKSLLFLESKFSLLTSYGPSIFVLAQKI